MTSAYLAARRIDLGRVFLETGAVIRSRWLILLGLGVLLWGADLLAGQLPLRRLTIPFLSSWVLQCIQKALSVLVATLFVVIATRVSLDALDHRSQGQSEWVPMVARPAAVLLPIRLLMGWLAFVPPSVIDATARALAAAARTSLTSALVFLIIVGQLIGLVYLALLGVLNPVAVAERRDLPTTVIRTMRLMARGRWSYLLLVFLVFGTISGAPRAALSFFARPTHLASTDYRLQLATLFEVVVRLGVLVFTAAYYRELCRATDGAVPGDIAATFD